MSSRPAAEIQLTIDGRPISVPVGITIFDAARVNGIPIPTLCHQQNENPVGVCRVCVVDIGQRVYAASCIRQCESGMTVKTATDQVHAARNTLVELLMSDHPAPCARQQQSRRLRTGAPCRRGWNQRVALPSPHHSARKRRAHPP